ncbi:MAG: hypothetical protein E6I76_09060 [Chloroflexi bacterium]|nr:MAG: hypothetical protein E6I76_09060 [Chloroflexota bacterium]
MTRRRVAVVCGGSSGEAAVSRDSGAQVLAALRARGHDCTLLECDAELPAALLGGGYEVAFLAVHGRLGEDGAVQGTCELLGIPYTGSGVLASALCFDKATAKRVMTAAGVTTPDWRLVRRDLDRGRAGTAMAEAAAELGLPLVVKTTPASTRRTSSPGPMTPFSASAGSAGPRSPLVSSGTIRPRPFPPSRSSPTVPSTTMQRSTPRVRASTSSPRGSRSPTGSTPSAPRPAPMSRWGAAACPASTSSSTARGCPGCSR